MEVEVTIDLDEEGYRKFQKGMEKNFIDDYDQWNIFFNAKDSCFLEKGKRARIRYIIPKIAQPKYTICVKAMGIQDAIEGGIARRREIEEEMTKEQIDAILHNPQDYYKLAPQALKDELKEFADKPFEFLLDFRSQRRIYRLGDFVVEADECTLASGKTFFQLELESERAEEARMTLEAKLDELGIKYTEAPFGKFKRLLEGAKEARFSPRLQAVIDADK